MTRVVEVRTGARLHFGLFATTPNDGPFGGIGMMIDRPGFHLRISRATRDKVEGPPEVCTRVADIVARVRLGLTDPAARFQVDDPSAPVAIRVAEVIPPHRGFGSGTQLAYAVAEGMKRALGVWPPVASDDDLGRGGRSAVGTLGFRDGGFVVDAGLRRPKELETGTARREVPPEWRFVVVDPHGSAGPSGTAEAAGFRSLPAMPRHMPDQLFGLVTGSILPALDEGDFLRFAVGLKHFNRLVGEHFAPAQGGVYAHPLIRELSQTLATTHWRYLAQSSWGPAAVIFCESQASAEALTAFLPSRLSPGDADVTVSAPRNRGAEITVIGET